MRAYAGAFKEAITHCLGYGPSVTDELGDLSSSILQVEFSAKHMIACSFHEASISASVILDPVFLR